MGVLAICYGVVVGVAHFLSYFLRFDFEIPRDQIEKASGGVLWVVPFKLMVLLVFGQFAGLISYFSIPDLRRLLYAVSVSSVVLFGVRFFWVDWFSVPRGVILLDFILTLIGLTSLRLGFRLVRERFLAPQSRPTGRGRNVGIIGAGDVGASLARELLSKRGLQMIPVAFFDDDSAKWRSRVHDILVVGAPEVLLDGKLDLHEVIIAMPTAPAKRMGEIVKILQTARIKFETVPSLDQLATGKVKVSQVRPVQIQDLLGRDPVHLEMESIRSILAGKAVLVSGAGGSIGSELSRQIAGFNPKRLILLDRSEVQLFPIEQELIQNGHGGVVLPLVADLCDGDRMRHIFTRFRPDVVFHAAAHKHVPMMESQPGEAIRNNVLGTVGLAELALKHRVDRFVLISTDKAINPTNVMGATKRLSEMFLQALSGDSVGLGKPSGTKFMAVRFGNVLGSSGSVIPIFTKQIAAGGPVTVTHPDVTRYFMTIPEAAGLVLQSASQGEGGEIFVLDMGKPVRISDLAKQLIELSGLRAEEDIEIKFTGLRPGEKLFEELNHSGEKTAPTNHPKIMRFVTDPLPLKDVRAHIDRLAGQLHAVEANQLKILLKQAVPEYEPYLTV